MKKPLLFLTIVASLVAACGSADTDTRQTIAATPTIAGTPYPPASPSPTPTPAAMLTPTITPTPVATVQFSTEAVSFTTEDGLELFGNFYHSEGDIAVVFAHMSGPNDQQNWVSFAKRVASRGFTALTFDFRCYGQSGCRGGAESESVLLSRDMGAAIGFLRSRGFERIVCMGASYGGRGCINAAFEEELEGLVIVSSSAPTHPDRQDLNNVINPDMSKLFIVSDNDPTPERTQSMILLYENAPEPKIFEVFSGTDHGTELFSSEHGARFRSVMLDFLEGIRSSAQSPGQ